MSTATTPARPARRRQPPAPEGSDDCLGGVKAGIWTLDSERSTLEIGVKVGGFVAVRGRFTHMSGEIQLANEIARCSIDVTVRTDSLTSGNSHWDSVLLGAGLVDTATNPMIGFRSVGLHRVSDSDHYELAGILTTNRGDLAVRFELICLGRQPERVRLRATGSIGSKDAVALLSQPGLERVIGKQMSIDLTVEATRGPRRLPQR